MESLSAERRRAADLRKLDRDDSSPVAPVSPDELRMPGDDEIESERRDY